MGSTSRIITDYVFTLVTFHFVRMSFGLSLSFSPAAAECNGCL